MWVLAAVCPKERVPDFLNTQRYVVLLARCNLQGAFLPGYQPVPDAPKVSYGLQRLDHAVGNVPELIPQVEYMARCLGERVLLLCWVGGVPARLPALHPSASCLHSLYSVQFSTAWPSMWQRTGISPSALQPTN